MTVQQKLNIHIFPISNQLVTMANIDVYFINDYFYLYIFYYKFWCWFLEWWWPRCSIYCGILNVVQFRQNLTVYFLHSTVYLLMTLSALHRHHRIQYGWTQYGIINAQNWIMSCLVHRNWIMLLLFSDAAFAVVIIDTYVAIIQSIW